MAYTNGARYPMKARTATTSRYAPHVPVAVVAPVSIGTIILDLTDGSCIRGIACYKGQTFENAEVLKDWLWAYRTHQPRQFAQGTILIDETEIYLSAIKGVR